MSSTTATRSSATRPRVDDAASEPGRPGHGMRQPARVPRPRLRLTGRGQLLVLLLLVLLVLSAFAVGRAASSQAMEPSDSAPALAQVTVQRGDTLWSIARQVAPQRDPREVVAQIRRLNHLPSAVVQAGRQLLLPVAV